MTTPELPDIDVALLLEEVFQKYGYDFRDYSPASIRRRIQRRVEAEGVNSISALQERVLKEPDCMERLLLGLTVHTSSMFRDPSFYVVLREKVVPLLQTYPFARIWHAGCSTGEEVYSLAILLQEEGVYKKCRIYATDLSHAVVQRAQEGLFPLGAMKEYTENYQQAGGKTSFSTYYTARYDHALFRPCLRENIVFAHHNLVTDGVFNEFNVILCRNVMIYFNTSLKERVHGLFHRSLARLGVLALGRKESLRFRRYEACYEEIDGPERLYRRVK